MTPQQKLWVLFGGLSVVCLVLLGSITLPNTATSPILTLIVLVAAGIAIHHDRQGRQHH
ncbi:MAG: hypothetical protein ABIU87_08005 [Ornithinibacter sp.]